MKALYGPVSILALLLAFSVLISSYVQSHTDAWIAAVEEISAISEQEHWNEAESRILMLHKDWAKRQKYFHLILTHQDLDETEKYFSGALAACHAKDTAELQIHLAQLTSQFNYLGKTQELSLQNIL